MNGILNLNLIISRLKIVRLGLILPQNVNNGQKKRS